MAILLSVICLYSVSSRSQIVNSPYEYNSAITEQKIPAALKTSEIYTVSLTLKNTGSKTWKDSDKIYLTLYNDNSFNFRADRWKVKNIPLPYSVSPGSKVTFLFNIKAPDSAGVYNCSWSMSRNNIYFGEIPQPVPVNVDKADSAEHVGPDYDSEILAQTVPSEMKAGEMYRVAVILRNTGKRAWVPYAGNYTLAFVKDVNDNSAGSNWNPSTVYIPKIVEPGDTALVEFDLVAPLFQGVYNFQWRLKKGENYFGEITKNVTVNVLGLNSIPENSTEYNSEFEGQDIDFAMYLNKETEVTITMKNTGSKPWIKGREHLVMVDYTMSLVSLNMWGLGYVNLPHDIEPGDTVSFKFRVRPAKEGWQNFQMAMMTGDSKIFGRSTEPVQIIVSK